MLGIYKEHLVAMEVKYCVFWDIEYDSGHTLLIHQVFWSALLPWNELNAKFVKITLRKMYLNFHHSLALTNKLTV
jgi:hypothetical protein